jgi:hypothetical protein
VLLDGQRWPADFDLLHDRGQVAITAQAATAAGTGLERVPFEMRDLLRRKRLAFVHGMSGLATDFAALGLLLGCRLGRFDDVGGRRFRGGRGVFEDGGEFLAEFTHLSLQRLDLFGLGSDNPTQTLALGTGLPCTVAHAAAKYGFAAAT